MSKSNSSKPADPTAEELPHLTWNEFCRRVMRGGSEATIKMLKAGATVIGRTVRAGVRAIGEFFTASKAKAGKTWDKTKAAYAEWKPEATANKVVHYLFPDLEARNQFAVPALALAAVALISTCGYALVLSGAVHGALSILVSGVAYCGHTVCSAEAAALPRSHTYGFVPTLLALGSVMAFLNLRNNAVRSLMASSDGAWLATNSKRVLHCGRYSYKNLTYTKRFAMKSWRWAFPNRDEAPKG